MDLVSQGAGLHRGIVGVTWEIEAQPGGVSKLTVIHDRLERSPRTAAGVAGGWAYVLSGLKTLLETGEPLGPRSVGAS